MQGKNIYLFTRHWSTGGSHSWKVEATPDEIKLLKELELEDWRVDSIDIEPLSVGDKPTHVFDTSGQLWCKTPINIYK